VSVAVAHRVSVDDLLGSAEGRFFSEGFRRVFQDVAEVRVVVEQGRASASAQTVLSYPADWSLKDSRVIVPHLSTVDAFVVSAQLVEAILAVGGVSQERRRAAWINHAEFRAGAAAQGVEEKIPSYASMSGAYPATRQGWSQLSFDCRVGPIQVTITALVETDGLKDSSSESLSICDLLGAGNDRLYGSGYRTRHHNIGDIMMTGNSATAAHIMVEGAAPLRDLGGDHAAGVSMVDCLLAQAQLSQILLLSLDDLKRSEAYTMWMRRVMMSVAHPAAPQLDGSEAMVRVTSHRLVTLRGERWRIADFCGQFSNIASEFNLAHRLPGQVVS
jgi:hypothetical protein